MSSGAFGMFIGLDQSNPDVSATADIPCSLAIVHASSLALLQSGAGFNSALSAGNALSTLAVVAISRSNVLRNCSLGVAVGTLAPGSGNPETTARTPGYADRFRPTSFQPAGRTNVARPIFSRSPGMKGKSPVCNTFAHPVNRPSQSRPHAKMTPLPIAIASAAVHGLRSQPFSLSVPVTHAAATKPAR